MNLSLLTCYTQIKDKDNNDNKRETLFRVLLHSGLS